MAAVTHSSAARPLGSASHTCEEVENLLTLMINLQKAKINYHHHHHHHHYHHHHYHHHHKTQNSLNIPLSISFLQMGCTIFLIRDVKHPSS